MAVRAIGTSERFGTLKTHIPRHRCIKRLTNARLQSIGRWNRVQAACSSVGNSFRRSAKCWSLGRHASTLITHLTDMPQVPRKSEVISLAITMHSCAGWPARTRFEVRTQVTAAADGCGVGVWSLMVFSSQMCLGKDTTTSLSVMRRFVCTNAAAESLRTGAEFTCFTSACRERIVLELTRLVRGQTDGTATLQNHPTCAQTSNKHRLCTDWWLHVTACGHQLSTRNACNASFCCAQKNVLLMWLKTAVRIGENVSLMED